MKDLYRNLKLSGRIDDPTLLGEAIAACDDVETAYAAKHILLNSDRKQRYDCSHRVLSTVGELRARLALPKTQQWEALGNQDFDTEMASTWTNPFDLLDDDELMKDAIAGEPTYRLPVQSNLDFTVPLRIAFGGAIVVASICVLLILSSLRQPKSVPLPEHGAVIRNDNSIEASETSTITFEAPIGRGHYYVEIASASGGWTVLTVFVHEGMRTSVNVAPGSYVLQFSVGEERDWGGDGFDPPLRQIERSEISVPPNKTIRLP